ncbi:hypothetical protein B0H14DRAFT_2592000 [Mycena olivaceomarginata]|nr:hypothetical protein B0H14DRAFT_2592000 [Mycena olivaceomarginata]
MEQEWTYDLSVKPLFINSVDLLQGPFYHGDSEVYDRELGDGDMERPRDDGVNKAAVSASNDPCNVLLELNTLHQFPPFWTLTLHPELSENNGELLFAFNIPSADCAVSDRHIEAKHYVEAKHCPVHYLQGSQWGKVFVGGIFPFQKFCFSKELTETHVLRLHGAVLFAPLFGPSFPASRIGAFTSPQRCVDSHWGVYRAWDDDYQGPHFTTSKTGTDQANSECFALPLFAPIWPPRKKALVLDNNTTECSNSYH